MQAASRRYDPRRPHDYDAHVRARRATQLPSDEMPRIDFRNLSRRDIFLIRLRAAEEQHRNIIPEDFIDETLDGKPWDLDNFLRFYK